MYLCGALRWGGPAREHLPLQVAATAIATGSRHPDPGSPRSNTTTKNPPPPAYHVQQHPEFTPFPHDVCRASRHVYSFGPPQVLYTLQLKMAQYRARAKAGWEASAASRAEQDANHAEGTPAGGVGAALSSEEKQALVEKEEENQV